MRCDALVDSGASVSVISQLFAEKLHLQVEENPTFPLCAVGDTQIKVQASTNVSLMINGSRYPSRFLVVQDDEELPILDFLRRKLNEFRRRNMG